MCDMGSHDLRHLFIYLYYPPFFFFVGGRGGIVGSLTPRGVEYDSFSYLNEAKTCLLTYCLLLPLISSHHIHARVLVGRLSV